MMPLTRKWVRKAEGDLGHVDRAEEDPDDYPLVLVI